MIKDWLTDYAGLDPTEIDEAAEKTLNNECLECYYSAFREALQYAYEVKQNIIRYGQLEVEEGEYDNDKFI